MSDKLEQLQKLRKQIRLYEDTLRHYEQLYKADGVIDAHEQKRLDATKNLIKKVVAKITKGEKKLDRKDTLLNALNTQFEAVQDWSSTKDDVVDHSLMEKKPNTPDKGASTPAPDKSNGSYSVVSGDTGYGIAKKLGIAFKDLDAANSSVKWSKLNIGQTLNVPGNSTDNNSSKPDDKKPDDKKPDDKINPIKKSVGADTKTSKANNDPEDVKIVQLLLNKNGIKVEVTGICDNKTIEAIKKFQASNFSWTPDGNIGANGKTWAALSLGKIKDDGLGVGADSTDSYKSQRDNKTLHLSGKRRSGDVQCNVTSLAMMLISLNGGNEAEVIDIVKKAIQKKGAKIKSSWGLEELLATYTDAIGKSINSSSNMGVVAAKLLKDKVSSSQDIWVDKNKPQDAITKCKKTILPLLKKGCEVIISGHFTKGGHIVSLRSIKSNGVMIQDPYGLCVTQGLYIKNGQVCPKKKFAKYQTSIKRRLSVNGRFEEIKKLVEKGKPLPQNLGSNNYYSWDDFGSMKIYRFVVAHKK